MWHITTSARLSQGDPDRRALAATWGAGQAHRVQGH